MACAVWEHFLTELTVAKEGTFFLTAISCMNAPHTVSPFEMLCIEGRRFFGRLAGQKVDLRAVRRASDSSLTLIAEVLRFLSFLFLH